MKKQPLIVIILIFLLLFVAADYYLNNLETEQTNTAQQNRDRTKPKMLINSLFSLNQTIGDYQVTHQARTSKIFEKIA